ncbi:MAG: ATP-dependent DNA helicase [Actinomycetota bacterium]|nr:ATP-dependent DNA helicase [Actinomycetota bacterium]
MTADAAADDRVDLVLAKVTGALEHAEQRPGQHEMAITAARALSEGRHAVIQAGTGTGKSLAYLVPAAMLGRPVVVVTATKALQDQLARKDLPFVAEHSGIDFDFAVVKGRSNYVCRQRLDELAGATQPALDLEGVSGPAYAQIGRLRDWADATTTGDIADLDWSPADATWRAVSVSSDECPGASKCPRGHDCFAENARRRAAEADITVVNMHLFGIDLASGGLLLPPHDAVVIDEAHLLEDVISDTAGVQIMPSQFRNAAAVVRRIVAEAQLVDALGNAAQLTHDALAGHVGERMQPGSDSLDWLGDLRLVLDECLSVLAAIRADSEDVKQRRLRAQQVVGSLAVAIDVVHAAGDTDVVFVGGTPAAPRLVVAPLDVAPVLRARLWDQRAAVLTSATIPAGLPKRLGIDDTEVVDVGSPFDYEANGLLYCAAHLPDPRDDGYRDRLHDELAALITAAGGRTLALFTSWKAMHAAADAVAQRVDVPVLSQGSLPKPLLLSTFAEDEPTCLFATVGLFSGVDVPGRTLSLVTVDRLPFARPDDPLLAARRDLVGARAFAEIDVPRAAMLLAQAAGRLIRNATDRGAVAVFDSRLATARYRWDIVRALPPMRRTRRREEIEAFLGELTATTP